METIPLSKIYSHWEGRLIPSAFAALRRGMELESHRLNGSSFVVLAFRREYDYDGLMESIDSLEGFSEKNDSIHHVEDCFEKAIKLAEARPTYGNYKWRVVNYTHNRLGSGHENQYVKSVHLQGFKAENGSGFDSMYLQFEVLQTNTSQIMGPALFGYLTAESEWVSYLIEKGSVKSAILAKIGLKDIMIQKDREPSIFDEKIFDTYAPKEYLEDSSLREMDEIYRMSERVLIHKSSGMRVHYVQTEDYSGEEVEYKLKNIFIKTLQYKTLEVEDVDFSREYFVTPEGKIAFSIVKKDSKDD